VVRGNSSKQPKGEKTLLWEYYLPLMEGIRTLGDQATRENLINYMVLPTKLFLSPAIWWRYQMDVLLGIMRSGAARRR